MELDEQKLIETARPHFASARAGDWEHALRVVRWVKELGRGRSDLPLLVTAAYIHDIGWSGVAPKGKLDFDKMLELESKANENTAELIARVLNELRFTESEIRAVTRLVAAADQHRSESADEAVIVDADNLSKLCLEHIEEKYRPESFPKIMKLWETELPSRIKTEKGKVLLQTLLPKLLTVLKQKVARLPE